MAIDDKHLEDTLPADSAVDKLRKRNRRIRPWQSSLVKPTEKKNGASPPCLQT